MMMAWGPDFAHVYNDAYRPILGSTKHPSLGSTFFTFSYSRDGAHPDAESPGGRARLTGRDAGR
jgi:hypothetical protein